MVAGKGREKKNKSIKAAGAVTLPPHKCTFFRLLALRRGVQIEDWLVRWCFQGRTNSAVAFPYFLFLIFLLAGDLLSLHKAKAHYFLFIVLFVGGSLRDLRTLLVQLCNAV